MKRVAIALAIVAWCEPGFAQQTPITIPSNRGEALLREGVELRRQGRDADALAVFARAYDTDHSPIAVAQMGLAEQALGRWLDAEAHVRSALASHGTPWVEQNRAAIVEAFATISQHVGRVELDGIPAGATITINGEDAGVAPLPDPVRVVAGDALVAVHASGYRDASVHVTVIGGESVHPSIVMSRGDEPSTSQHAGLFRPIAYGLAGGAVLGIALGVTGIALHEGNVNAYNRDAACPGIDALTQPTVCGQRLDTGRMGTALEVAGFVTAGVFAAGAVTLWLLAARAPEARRTAAVRVACGTGPGDVGISCMIRY